MKHEKTLGNAGAGHPIERRALVAIVVGNALALAAVGCTSGESGTSGCAPGKDAGQHPGATVDSGSSTGKPSIADSGRGGHHPAGDAGGGNSAADSGTGDAASAVGLLTVPSNVPASAIDTAGAGDVVLNDDCFADSSTGELGCSGTSDVYDYYQTLVDQPGGGSARLYVMKTLRVAQSGQLHVYGGVPAIFFALDTVKIDGTVDGAHGGNPSAGGFEQAASGHGGGPGGGDAAIDYNAGGGGSYCGIGGKGGPGAGTPASKGGKAYGTPDLLPLLGGSSGGGEAGINSSGGDGGAAIELAAGRSLSISLTGVVNVGGNGGHANGGAAGSGGAILLEAPSITVRGLLAANGGGGALFNGGSSGQSGQPSDSAALASSPTGGQGSAGATVNGGDGTLEGTSVNTAGGGGGGAGRIRINTGSGHADVTGATLSPAATTPCVSEGTL